MNIKEKEKLTEEKIKLRERVAYNFKRLRLKHGYTQEKLAEAASVSLGYIAQIENGLVGFGTRAETKWAKFFKCDINEFKKRIDEVYIPTEIMNLAKIITTLDIHSQRDIKKYIYNKKLLFEKQNDL